MKTSQRNSLRAVVSILAFSLAAPFAHAASETWSASASGSWATAGNWNLGAGPAPGATSGTTNTDTATFNGTNTIAVTVDNFRNIGSITFNTTSSGKYTLNSGTLVLTGGGTILQSGAGAETINSSILLEGNYSFTDSTAATTSNLNFGGPITSDTGVGGLTLTIGGAGTGTSTISGPISDGSGSGNTVAVTKSGSGIWNLTGTNSYSGATKVNGGTLILSGAGQITNSAVTLGSNTFFNLTDSATSGAVTRAGSVTANGSVITETGSTANSNDTISTLTLGPGYFATQTVGVGSSKGVGGGDNTIVVTPGTANTLLTIGNLVPNTGGTVEFTTATTSVNLGANAISGATSGANIQINEINGGSVSSGLVGGGGSASSGTASIIPFATGAAPAASSVVPSDFVTYDPNDGVELLTGYVSNFANAATTGTFSNVKETGANDSISANLTINSLILAGTSNPATYTLNGHALAVTSGALLMIGSNGNTTITTGTLALGSGGSEGYVWVGSGRTDLISASITGPTAGLTITYPSVNNAVGNLILSGTNSYSGGTIVNGGGTATTGPTLQIGGTTTTTAGATGQLGSGNVILNNANLAFALTVNQSVSNIISSTGPVGNVSLTAADTGTITLSGGNSYTGSTTINGGALSVATLNSVSGGSATSSLGAPTSIANGTIAIGSTTIAGKLIDTGTGETTDRVINLAGTTGGATIDQSGTGSLEFTSNFTATGAGVKTLTLQGSTSGTGKIDGAIVDNSGTNTTSVTKAGTGTWTLAGANSYTGATTISAGNLIVGSTGSLASGSAVSVNGGTLTVNGAVAGTVGVAHGATLSGNGGTMGALTVAGGGIINTQDGAIGTLNGSTLTLTAPGGNGNVALDLDLGSSNTADLLSLTGAATMNNDFTVNVNGLAGAGSGTYTIMTASGGGLAQSDFSAGTLGGALSGDSMSFVLSGNSIELVIAGASAPTSYYFTGANSNTFTDPGNYNTLATGTTSQTGNALSATSNVFLDATSPAPQNTPPTLNNSATINTLTFLTGGETLAGSGTLTLMASSGIGITDSAGNSATTETIDPSVVLGSNQSWVATANSTLNVTGSISGAQTLALTGSGTYELGGANTFSGLTVGTGSDTPTVLLTNGSNGSATGTTTLTVNAGATLGGTGTSSGTSFTIQGTGTATNARANVLVGLNSSTDMSVATTLTLKGTAAGTIQNANLTFNLNSAVAGGLGTDPANSGTELNVGSTAITFGSNSKSTMLTLNLIGSSVIGANTAYVLVAGNTAGGADQYTNLSLGTSTGSLSTGLITPILNSGFGGTGNLTIGLSAGAAEYYGNGSYLFLYQDSMTGADDIEVEVVPEPSTWVLIASGLMGLFYIQKRRKSKI